MLVQFLRMIVKFGHRCTRQSISWWQSFALVSVLIVAVTACAPAQVSTPEPTATITSTPPPLFDRKVETYQIYEAALNNWCSPTHTVALDLETFENGGFDQHPNSDVYLNDERYNRVKEGFSHYTDDSSDELERSTYDDYYQQTSSEPLKLDRNHDYGRPIEYISNYEFSERIDQLGGWDSFYEANPEHCALVGLSHVGFNDTGTQAMLVFVSESGDLACLDEYQLWQKWANQWQLVSELLSSEC
jgi:hypothetical protein